jgi:hypothetical protein
MGFLFVYLGLVMCARLGQGAWRAACPPTPALTNCTTLCVQKPFRDETFCHLTCSLQSVRPIHWSNRPKAYVSRTLDWEAYPRGRWGDARSPAYGALSDYPFLRRHTGNAKRAERARTEWGEPVSVDDVGSVFTRYCTGEVRCCNCW